MSSADADAERESHLTWMQEAMNMAEEALQAGEVPVGCIFVRDNKIIAKARNRTNELRNASTSFPTVACLLKLYCRPPDMRNWKPLTVF